MISLVTLLAADSWFWVLVFGCYFCWFWALGSAVFRHILVMGFLLNIFM